MPNSPAAEFGAEIRRLREERGLSQSDLAERVGKSQAAVSFWEKGRRVPDLVDLLALARALDIDFGALVPRAPSDRSMPAVLRAQADRVLVDDLSDAVVRFADDAEREPAPPVELRISNDSPVGAAQELLAIAGIDRPPVPVEDLARRCGVRVRPFGFARGVSGFLLILDSGPVIGYRRRGDTPGRRRFSIAHELGHYLLRHYHHFHVDLDEIAMHGNPPGYDWRDERAANDFAAQLLMPAGLVTQAYKKTPDIDKLAERFQVSRQAMGFRLTHLGLRA